MRYTTRQRKIKTGISIAIKDTLGKSGLSNSSQFFIKYRSSYQVSPFNPMTTGSHKMVKHT